MSWTDDGVDVDTTLTLIRHTGDPEKAAKFKLFIAENTVRSFADAQINLEFSGIPDDVEVTIDAWAATAENLETEGLWWIKPLTSTLTLTPTPAEVADTMNAQLAINKPGTLVAVITAEDNKASVLTGAFMRTNNDAILLRTSQPIRAACSRAGST